VRGDLLRRLRRLRGMTQADLAQEVGVWPQTVRAWEAGKAEPRPHAFRRLCEVLAIAPEELYTERPDQE